MTTTELKQQLHQLCQQHVQQRMEAAQQGIAAAQQSANEETKSSAGDKYETGRAMMQQETNRNLTQLNEANKLLVALNQIGVNGQSKQAEAGSVVITDNGNFYLSISAGALLLNGETYYAISPGSPIGMKMKGQGMGEKFNLNGKEYVITEVM